MTLFVVDTNVLVYAAEAEASAHDASYGLLLQWQEHPIPWHLTWGIAYEFLRVVTHPRVLRSPFTPLQAWQFIESLLSSPSVTMLAETPCHGEILSRLLKQRPSIRGNMVFDARTVVLMLENGIRTIYTPDNHFKLFPEIEVVDPLQAAS